MIFFTFLLRILAITIFSIGEIGSNMVMVMYADHGGRKNTREQRWSESYSYLEALLVEKSHRIEREGSIFSRIT